MAEKDKPKLRDDHIHLRPHSVPPRPHDLGTMLEAAASAGVVPGVREHPPLPSAYRLGPHGDFDYAMNENETDRFFELFAERGAPVGFEFDYIAGQEEETERIIRDMERRADEAGVAITGIIGSVHLLPGNVKDVDYPKGGIPHVMWDLDENVFIEHLKDRGPERLLKDYFGAMRELVSTGLYDTLGHIELIRKFDRRNSGGDSIYFGGAEDIYRRLAMETVELAAGSGMAVEINTAGMFSPIGRPYISQELLDHAVGSGVPVCLGSDAHMPDRVGAHFDLALRMLESAGCPRLVTFMNREKIEYEWA